MPGRIPAMIGEADMRNFAIGPRFLHVGILESCVKGVERETKRGRNPTEADLRVQRGQRSA